MAIKFRYIKNHAILETLEGSGKAGPFPEEGTSLISTVVDELAEDGDFSKLVDTDNTQTIAGAKTFSANMTLGENLVFTETNTSPATSTSYSVVQKTISHTTTSAATNTVDIDVPVGAKLLGASAIVTTAITFASGGASADLTWSTSGEDVATTLAAKNTKGSALFDDNAATAIVSGSVETMTLTPDSGTIVAGGVILVTAWYEQITNFADVA